MFTRQQFIEPGLFRRLDQTHADLPQQHGFLRQSLNDCLRKMNRHALTQTNPQRLRQQIPLKPLSLNPYCYSLTTAVSYPATFTLINYQNGYTPGAGPLSLGPLPAGGYSGTLVDAGGGVIQLRL